MRIARIDPRSARTPSFNSKKFPAMCEAAHISRWDWQPIRRATPRRCGLERSAGGRCAENKSVEPQRAENRTRPAIARLRFERIDRLFLLRDTAMHTRLRRLLYLFTVGRYGRLPPAGGVKELLGDRWRSRLPMLFGALARKYWSLRLARCFQLLSK